LHKLSSREKRLLVSVIILFYFLGTYVLLLEPARKKYRQVTQEIALKEAGLRKALLIIDRKREIENQLQKYAGAIQMTGSAEEEIAKLLTDIEILSANLVSFTSVKPRAVRDLGFYKQLVVEVECETDIMALTKFIYQIEHSNKMLEILRLRIEASEGGAAPLKGSILIAKVLVPQK